MQYNKKNCPAVVLLYYYVDGVCSAKAISNATGISHSSVWQILHDKSDATASRELTNAHTIDLIEAEYLEGASTYELGDKHAMCNSYKRDIWG